MTPRQFDRALTGQEERSDEAWQRAILIANHLRTEKAGGLTLDDLKTDSASEVTRSDWEKDVARIEARRAAARAKGLRT